MVAGRLRLGLSLIFMGLIPIEDNYCDILLKAQKGLGATWERISHAASVSMDDINSLIGGKYNDVVARKVARHLHLGPNALSDLVLRGYMPKFPSFKNGFNAFNTRFGDMTVNSYLIWDKRSKQAAAFDTGAECGELLDLIKQEGLTLKYLFLTHNHPDHVAQIEAFKTHTNAEIWIHDLDRIEDARVKYFVDAAFFHVGPLSIKAIHVGGHTAGSTVFYVTGLSYPTAIVGDAIFAASMGKSASGHLSTISILRKKILSALPADTVLACGHGPVTSIAEEKLRNPFFAK